MTDLYAVYPLINNLYEAVWPLSIDGYEAVWPLVNGLSSLEHVGLAAGECGGCVLYTPTQTCDRMANQLHTYIMFVWQIWSVCFLYSYSNKYFEEWSYDIVVAGGCVLEPGFFSLIRSVCCLIVLDDGSSKESELPAGYALPHSEPLERSRDPVTWEEWIPFAAPLLEAGIALSDGRDICSPAQHFLAQPKNSWTWTEHLWALPKLAAAENFVEAFEDALAPWGLSVCGICWGAPYESSRACCRVVFAGFCLWRSCALPCLVVT